MIKIETERKLIELIAEIVKRPSLFDVNKAEDIHLFLLGYHYGSSAGEKECIYNLLQEFNRYVMLHYKWQDKAQWHKLIRLHCGSDADSIKLFAKLFKSFVKSYDHNYKEDWTT